MSALSVSGTVGARANNGTGLAGVAPGVTIMPLVIGGGSTVDVLAGAEAIRYAVDHGADVVNASWGGPVTGYALDALRSAVAYAAAHDVLVVAAAGNDSGNRDTDPMYPASLTDWNVVTVGASTAGDGMSTFSAYGAGSVDLFAPGTRVVVTTNTGGYALASGTSFSSPMVAAAVALYRAAMPSATAAEIKQALLADVDPLPAFSGRSVTGGRLTMSRLTDAAETVRYAFTSMTAPAGVVSPGIGVTGPTTAGDYEVVLGLGMEDAGEIWALSGKAVTLDGVTGVVGGHGDAVFPLGSLAALDGTGLSPTMELNDGRYVLTVQTYRDGSPVGRMYAAPLLVGSAVPTPGSPDAPTPDSSTPGTGPDSSTPDGTTPDGSASPGAGTEPTVPREATAPRDPAATDPTAPDPGSTPDGSGTSPGATGPGTAPDSTSPGTSPDTGSDGTAPDDGPSVTPVRRRHVTRHRRRQSPGRGHGRDRSGGPGAGDHDLPRGRRLPDHLAEPRRGRRRGRHPRHDHRRGPPGRPDGPDRCDCHRDGRHRFGDPRDLPGARPRGRRLRRVGLRARRPIDRAEQRPHLRGGGRQHRPGHGRHRRYAGRRHRAGWDDARDHLAGRHRAGRDDARRVHSGRRLLGRFHARDGTGRAIGSGRGAAGALGEVRRPPLHLVPGLLVVLHRRRGLTRPWTAAPRPTSPCGRGAVASGGRAGRVVGSPRSRTADQEACSRTTGVAR
jgi:hypothetical protein